MDHDERWDLDVPDLDLPLDDDGGDDGDHGDDDPPRGGGGRRPRVPPPEPFFNTRWGPLVTVAALLLFGLQSVFVVWVSRSGLGTEAMAWGIAAVFIVSFTTVFIAGARFIAKHRH